MAEQVLAAADVFAKELMEVPESAFAETAQAFANKMREPDQTVYLKSERVAHEVQSFYVARIECNHLSPMQVFDRTFRFSRRLEMAQVFERLTKVAIVAHVL